MNKRILVIDDEPIICEALSRFLTAQDYVVRTVRDMTGAWEALAGEPFDLALLDLGLAGENGLDLLPQIKEKFPEMPILILTAREFEEGLLQEAAEKGASGYVTKGLLSEHLLGEIKRLLYFPGKRPAFWDRKPPRNPGELGR